MYTNTLNICISAKNLFNSLYKQKRAWWLHLYHNNLVMQFLNFFLLAALPIYLQLQCKL